MLWVLIIVTNVIFIYYKLYKPHTHWKKRNVIHQKPLPVWGNIAPVTFRKTSLTEWLQDLGKKFSTRRYFGIYQFLAPTLVITDPDLIKQIGIKDFEYFLDHKTFLPEEINTVFGKNLFKLTGEKWRHMRSVLSPAFTSSKMKTMFILISECADNFTDNFLNTIQSGKHTSFDMKDVFTRFATDIIAACAFGIKNDSLVEPDNEFYTMGKRATNCEGIQGLKFFLLNISPFLIKLFGIELTDKDVANFFTNIVRNNIQQRKEKGIFKPDMINLLMEAKKGKLKQEESSRDKNDETGFATAEKFYVRKENNQNILELSIEDMAAQAMIFFLAGFDTVATTLCYMAYELAVHHNIQQKLQKEIDNTLKSCENGKITFEAITKMKYLDMVVSETFRKWPFAVLTDRVCTKPYTIKPINSLEKTLRLNKGDHIWFPIYSIHRNPNNYPNPNKFDPERFNDDNKSSINPSTYIPFGIGPRNCIGSRFALLEIKTIFVYLLSKLDIIVDQKTSIPLKLSKTNFNLYPEDGFWMALKPRDKYIK